jgi:hypothetical protein
MRSPNPPRFTPRPTPPNRTDASGNSGFGATSKPSKKKRPVSALAETMASAAMDPARFVGSAVKGVAGTVGRAGKLLSGENPYKKK